MKPARLCSTARPSSAINGSIAPFRTGATLIGTIVRTEVAAAPAGSVAVIVMATGPACDASKGTTPVISPVAAPIESHAGRPVAV